MTTATLNFQNYKPNFALLSILLIIVGLFSLRGYAPSPALWSLLLFMGAVFSFPTQGYSPRIHFPPTPLYFSVKKTKDSSETEKMTLHALVQSRVPTLFSDFRPAWWLFNGHLQTGYCVAGNFSNVDKVVYYRTYLRLIDGGTLGLDFTPAEQTKIADDTPILFVLHGLTGGSYESYVRSIVAPACAPVEQGGLGYRGVVMNFRGCAGVPLTSQKMYSAACTDDVRQALMYVANRYPNAPLYGVGFSLGANVMTRYLAEEGLNSRIKAACTLACPWNITKNGDALNATFTGRIYSRSLGTNLLNMVKLHRGPLSVDPEHPVAKTLASTLALKSPLMDDFDDQFTRIAGGAAPFPFPSARAYYTWASTHKIVADVKVPYLAINTADDPVVTDVPMDAGGNPYTVMVLTPNGGHLGWFETSGLWKVRRWITKPVLEWLRLVAEDMVLDPPAARQIYSTVDGFLQEAGGRDDLGCKVLEGGGIVDGDGTGRAVLQGF